MQNKAIVITGFSGAGKGEAGKFALKTYPQLMLSVSANTRPPRPDETDGVHYHFWQRSRFQQGINEGLFVEWQQVYPGDEGFRGTLASELPRIFGLGRVPFFDLEVYGAAKMKEIAQQKGFMVERIFIRPESLEQWEQKLREREEKNGTPLDEVEKRIRKAPEELAFAERAGFEHTVLNAYDDIFFNRIDNCLHKVLGVPVPFAFK